jgi:hypothetical protein
MKNPVLFLVFNRPETTRRVFAAIRAARPPKLYVAADGPRPTKAGELAQCNEVRRIATSVDWPCEVKTLFRESNLGCKMGVSGGISWFFDHEPQGIVLEDDVLPMPSFFDYCDELLERYRDDARVTMVSGCNLVADRFHVDESYFFARSCHIWGWASWRRAWRYYDVRMPAWPAWRDGGGLKALAGGNPLFEFYWRRKFDSCYEGRGENTWDYQWTFASWLAGGLSAVSAVNQVRNLGFGDDATHTTKGTPEYVTACPALPLGLPLVHPNEVVPQPAADAMIDSRVYGINVVDFARRGMRLARRALGPRRFMRRHG